MSDETIAYRDALVTKGLSIEDAAAIAAKTKQTKLNQKTAIAKPLTEGDKPANKKKAGKTAITKHDERLLQTGAEIAGKPPTGNDMAFFHAVMCQVGLPRSKVEGTTFERRSGSASLLIEAGAIRNLEGEWEKQIIPYGALPRLILAWMNTFAVRH